jgi:hypothetical protein
MGELLPIRGEGRFERRLRQVIYGVSRKLCGRYKMRQK